jgi:hypothetical protein
MILNITNSLYNDINTQVLNYIYNFKDVFIFFELLKRSSVWTDTNTIRCYCRYDTTR